MAALVTLAIRPLPWRVPQFLPLEGLSPTDVPPKSIARGSRLPRLSPFELANKYPNIVEYVIVGNESLGQNSFKTLLELLFRVGTGERGVAGRLARAFTLDGKALRNDVPWLGDHTRPRV